MDYNRYKQMMEQVEFLKPYEQADGTEWGEMINYLCLLASRIDYVTDDLAEQIALEISENVAYVKEHATIVERSEIFTRKVIDVEWDDR